jgi:hypothetical protein
MAEKGDLIAAAAQESQKRSGEPKIIFKKLTGSLTFYRE